MATRWDFERAVMASDLPALTRLVLLVLATYTEGGTALIPAKHTPSLTTLATATGMALASVKVHLNLAEKLGWVRRDRPPVELARSKKARTRYLLSDPSRPGGDLDKADSRPGDGLALGRETATGLGRETATSQSFPDLVSPLRARTRAESLIADAGAQDDEEIQIVIKKIRTEHQPKSLGGYVASMADNGDLPAAVAAALAEHRRGRLTEALAELRRKPPCEHGQPGGDQLHPTGGEPLCITCRFQRRRSA